MKKALTISIIFCFWLFSYTELWAQCTGTPITSFTLTSKTDVTCYNANTGEIVVTLAGGQPPFTYSLVIETGTGDIPIASISNTNSQTATFSNLFSSDYEGGNYKVTVITSNSTTGTPSLSVCRRRTIQNIDLTQPDELVASVASITHACTANSGAINLDVTGGSPFPGNPKYTYIWSGPTAIANTVEDPTNLSAGTYSVTIRDANYNAGNPGFCEVTIPNIIVQGQPTITLGVNPQVCVGTISSSISYSAITDSPDLYRIDWASGITDVPLTALPASPIPISGIPVVAGTYTGNLYVSNSTTGCESIAYPISVTVNPLPTATISYSGSPYCATGTATVTRTGQGGGTYSSTAGLSIIASTGEINLATSTPGSYVVTYSFTNGTCSNTTTANVTINALPTATISYSGSPYCATGTATVTQTGQGGGTYSSTAGLSINASTGAINLATSTPGSYVVTYSFTDGTCSNTTTANVTINALPTATISYSGSPYCATGTATVTQTGQGGGTYSSTAGLSINASTGAIDLATSTPGSYIVTYSFTDGTCSNTATANVTINALPVVTVPQTSLCVGATMNASPATAGTWVSSNSAIATIDNAGLITAVSAGSATFTFTETATGCSATTVSVTINALPVATISYSGSPYCAIGTANVTQTGQAGGTYSSTSGLSLNSSTGAIDLAASTPGSYLVTYSFTDGTCSNTTTANVTINALPVVNVPQATLCVGATMNASPGTGGTWVSSNPAVATIDNAGLVTAVSVGTVTFTFTETATGCVSITSSVTVNPLPIVSLSQTTLCVGATMNATPSSGGTWVSSDPAVAIVDNAGLITAVSSGTASFTFTETSSGCSTTTATVTVNPLPTGVVSGDATICEGSSTNLQFTFTGTGPWTYQYTDGTSTITANSATNTATVSVSPTTTTTYTLVSVSDANCNSVPLTASVQVNVNAIPNSGLPLSASVDPVCTGGSSDIVVSNSEVGVTYQLRNDADDSLVGVAVSGTGASINLQTGALTATTTFNVLAIGPSCSTQLIQVIDVTVFGVIDPASAVTAQNSLVCEGLSTNIQVSDSKAGVLYQLRDNSDNSNIGLEVAGNGGTIFLPTGNLNQTKTFNVLAFSLGFCSIELNDKVTVQVEKNPDVTLSLSTLGTTLCTGGGTQITVVGSEVGVSYQLRNDADDSVVGTAVVGTGSNIDLPTEGLNATTTFNILATSGVCASAELTTTVTINVSGSVNLNLTPLAQSSPICAGASTNIQIANSEVAVTYQLIDDSDNSVVGSAVAGTGASIDLPTGLLTTTKTYRVQVSNGSCTAELTSDVTVNVNPLPLTSVPVTAPASVCDGTSTFVQVANSEAGVFYQLRNDADDSVVSGAVLGNGNSINLPTGVLTTAKTFNVLATSGTCSAELATVVTITIDPAPSITPTVSAQDPLVCSGSSTFVQVLNSEAEIVYQLRDNADNSIVSGAVFGNGATINLPTGPITADRTFNVTASNTICTVQLTTTVSVQLRPANDPACSNCSVVAVSTTNATKVTCNAAVPDGSITFVIEPPKPVVDIIGVKIQIAGPVNKTQTNDFVFTGLAAGNYTYVVTYGDENNPDCIKTGSFVIEVSRVPDPITFDAIVDDYNCIEDIGSITLENIAGAASTDFSYEIFVSGSSVSTGTITSSAASGAVQIPDLVVGDYEIQLSQNQQAANGCVGVVTSSLVPFSIEIPAEGCEMFIPNIFTPNGDGVNDSFFIRNLLPGSSVSITNRWGKEVYAAADYQNNWTADSIADGVYYYRVVVEGKAFTGWVEILRGQ